MFYRKGNTFVRPEKYTQWINSVYKQNKTKTPEGTFKVVKITKVSINHSKLLQGMPDYLETTWALPVNRQIHWCLIGRATTWLDLMCLGAEINASVRLTNSEGC